MKCVKGMKSGEVFRTSERHAAEIVRLSDPGFKYVPKAEWKAQGRKRSGPQDHAPNSIHPRRVGGAMKKKGGW